VRRRHEIGRRKRPSAERRHEDLQGLVVAYECRLLSSQKAIREWASGPPSGSRIPLVVHLEIVDAAFLLGHHSILTSLDRMDDIRSAWVSEAAESSPYRI
jgi:hypothetical protein